VHTWDRTSGGERSFRLDRMRSARLRKEGFRPREGFDPRSLRDARRARILYSPEVARWQVERGARPLADGSALAETAVGSPEWLVGEILSFRGEAVVLEPADLRRQIAARAKQLAQEVRTARVT
jgi:predicted DNA-binding transcriptional regulator YafY